MIKKILISQPQPTSDKSPYFDIAKDYDVDLVFRPFIKVEGLTSKEFRQQKVSITGHTAIVFTSRHAIDNFFKLAKEMRLEIPEDMKYFCRSMCSIAKGRCSSVRQERSRIWFLQWSSIRLRSS